MKRLFIARHGETAWNSDNRVQGSVDVPLSEEGVRQAEALADFLAGLKVPFGRIYASDLSRAATTGKIIAARLGAGECVQSPLLRELNCGEWEGRAIAELREEQAEAYRAWRHDPGFAVPGGESLVEMKARVEAFFAEEAEALGRHENVLLVAHGLFNRMILAHLMGLDPQQSRFFAQDNAALSVFEWIRGRCYCLAWNIACHL